MEGGRKPGGGADRRGIRGLIEITRARYAGADLPNAGRLVAVICSLSSLLALAFLPLDPPTEAIGGLGWFLAALLIAAGFVGGRVLRRRRPPLGFDALLAVTYTGLLSVAILQWLGGGVDATYRNLTLLWLGAAMGIHPLPRALAFLAATTVVTAAPVVYGDPSAAELKELAANYLFWVTLGFVMLGLMSYIRAQRVSMRDLELRARESARVDTLSGLGNRRAFDEAVETELARGERARSTTSVGLIDIDGFKAINDRHGHLDGDRCLREIAAAIGRARRGGDAAFRWGGDEFALLLADTDLEGAERAMARIAAEVLNTCADADGVPIAVSWGVAVTEPGMGARELLGRADLALMTLKREKLQA